MLNRTQYRIPRQKHDTSIGNPLYKDFWNKQAEYHTKLATDSYNSHKNDVSQLDAFVKERNDELMRRARERNNQGFWKDFGSGFKETYNSFYKPFHKYVIPIIGKIGGENGKAIEKSSNAYTGIVEKLT